MIKDKVKVGERVVAVLTKPNGKKKVIDSGKRSIWQTLKMIWSRLGRVVKTI